jgi:hypothetical protein
MVDLLGRPYCCDCVWYAAAQQECENPAVKGLLQLVVGDRGPVGVAATVPRFSEALCGLEGRWFKGR